MRNYIFTLFAIISLFCATTLAFAVTGRYEVTEFTFPHTSAGINNVWEDETLTVQLTSPTGKTYSIHGFFYTTNAWKFRFAPDEIGTWNYTGTFSGVFKAIGKGTFQCAASTNPGFIRRNPTNKYGWVFSDGSPYYLFGCQDGVAAGSFTATYWELGELKSLNMDQYLDVLASQCGVNCWRITVDPGFAPYAKLGDVANGNANIYHEVNSMLYDTYVQKLRARNMRIVFVLFNGIGAQHPYGQMDKPDLLAAQQRYIRYVIDRYGPYVDFWEISNELARENYADAWLDSIIKTIRTYDPQVGRPISISWDRPDYAGLDFDSYHQYWSPTPDQYFELGNNWAKTMPTVFTEVGNSNASDEPESADRWRVGTWCMFFKQTYPIFWQTGGHYQPASKAANLSFKAALRANFKRLADWRTGFDGSAISAGAPDRSTNEVEAFSLKGNTMYAIYLYDKTHPTTARTGMTVSLPDWKAGTGQWYDPKIGQLVGAPVAVTGKVGQSLAVPSFTADIVFKVVATVGVGNVAK